VREEDDVSSKERKLMKLEAGVPRVLREPAPFKPVIRPVPMLPEARGPHLVCPSILFEEIMVRAAMLTIEVSGFGFVQPRNGHLILTELVPVTQRCSGASTTIDDICAHKMAMKQLEHPDCGILWWHSHAGMGVFWSGTDENTMRSLFQGWGVALVVNHKREYKIELVNNIPVPTRTILPLYIQPVYGALDLERIQKDLEKDVCDEEPLGLYDLFSEYPRYEDYTRCHEGRREEDDNRQAAAEGSRCDYCDQQDCPDRGRWVGFALCPHLSEDGVW